MKENDDDRNEQFTYGDALNRRRYVSRLDHMRHTDILSMVSTQLTTSHKDRLFFIFSLQLV